MPRHRIHLINQIYFITTCTFKSRLIFSDKINCEVLLNNVNFYRAKLKFKLLAYCVLPDHVHLLIMPDEKNNISQIMQQIKYRTASDIRKLNSCSREPGSRLRRDNVIWQKSFYDKIIRSDEELHHVLNYINHNAIKHNMVPDSTDWIYSSFHHYKNTGSSVIAVDEL